MTALYLLFLCLVCSSAFFSSSETAFFSLSKHQRHRLSESASRAARRAARLRDQPRALLVTVLFGNELTNIALSIVSASILSRLLSDLSLVQQALLSASIVVPTLLIFGEITPKSIAALLSERVAVWFAYPLSAFSWLITPARWVLLKVADAFTKLLGAAESGEDHGLDEESFKALIDVGTREGVLAQDESALIHNAFQFNDRRVGEVMTAWSETFKLDDHQSVTEVIEVVSERGYSRVPVWSASNQMVTGVLHTKDLLIYRWRDSVDSEDSLGALHNTHDVSEVSDTSKPLSSEAFPEISETFVTEALEEALENSSERSERSERSESLEGADVVTTGAEPEPPSTVKQLAHRTIFTTPDTPLTQLLDIFKRSRKHFSIVIEPATGAILGICTLEDVLEVLFGPIEEDSSERGLAREGESHKMTSEA